MLNFRILCMICFLLIMFTILNGEEIITTSALPIPSRLNDSSDQLGLLNSSYVYTAQTAGRFITLNCIGSDMGVNASSITFAQWIVPWHSSLRCGIYMPAGKRVSNDDQNKGSLDSIGFNDDSHDKDIVTCDESRGVKTSRYNLSLNIQNGNTSFTGIYSCIAWRNSEAWKTIIILTVQDKPTAPTSLDIHVTSETTFQVTWRPPLLNNNSSITHYKVTWFKYQEFSHKQSNNGNWMRDNGEPLLDEPLPSSQHAQSTPELSLVDRRDAKEIQLPERQLQTKLMDLTPYTRYCVEVRACNAIGWSPPVSSCLHRTLEGRPLDSPMLTPQPVNSTSLAILMYIQNLTHVYGQLRGFKVKLYQRSSLSGVGNSDAIALNRQPDDMLNQSPDRTMQINSTKSSYAIFVNDLQPWTNYEIRVSFFNGRFDSPSTTKIVHTKEGVPEAPRFVNLPVKTVLSTSVQVNWVQPRNLNGRLTGYEVQYFKRMAPTVYLPIRSIVMDVGNEIIINKLEPATEYRVRVAAKTASGTGDWSGNMTVRTDVAPPGQAINVAVETGYTSVGPVLMWQPPESDFAFNLYFSICWKVDGLDLTCQNPIGPPPDGTSSRRGHLRRCNCKFFNGAVNSVAAQSSVGEDSSSDEQVEGGGGNQRCIPDLTKLCFLMNWAQFKDAVEMAQRRGHTTRPIELTFLIRARLRSMYRSDTFMDGVDSMPVHLMMPLQRLKYLVSNPKPIIESEINQQTLIAGVIVAACVVLIIIAIVIFLSWRWAVTHHRGGYMGPIGHHDNSLVDSASVHYPNNLYSNGATTTLLPALGNNSECASAAGTQITILTSNGHGRHSSNGRLQPPALKKYGEWRFAAIPVAEFGAYVVRCHADSNHKFLEEWDEVNANTQKYPSVVCDSVENRAKNRYTDILCFDHSRVILHSKPHVAKVGGSDYINANFVDGYHAERAFIAAQGPVPDTFEDFWLMVWENFCPVIVMISNLVECGRRKCDKYWPSEGVCTYGQMQVRFVRQLERSYYIYRILGLRRLHGGHGKKQTKERLIHHYHYTEWPDFGVPTQPLQVLQFMQRSASHWRGSGRTGDDGGPMVVHCSAGVGRTGTYICIEAQIRQINRERNVNVKAWLSHIRQQRVRLVQSEQQYYFIHDALAEYLLYPEHEVHHNHLRNYVSSLLDLENCGCTRLQRQFQLCTAHQPDPSTQMVARKSFNLDKSRSDIYPLDKCRVKLTTVGEPYPQERADYINASQLTGFYSPREFIITQHPMEHTITDLWRMVWDQNSPHIILLSDMKRCNNVGAAKTVLITKNGPRRKRFENRELLDDNEDTEDNDNDDNGELQEEEDEELQNRLFRTTSSAAENLPQFWPSVGANTDYGYLQVAFRGCEELSHVIKTEFLMGNSRDDYSLVTNLWQYRSFPTNVSEALEMVRFVNLLQERNRDCCAPLIVMDALGGSRAAFFCALIYCLNQLNAESCVDVYMVVKMYHLQRPGVWSQPADIDRVELLYRTLEAVAQDLQLQPPTAPSAHAVTTQSSQSNGGMEHNNGNIECVPLSRRLSFPPVSSSNGSAVRTSQMSASRCSTLVRHVYSTSGASASSNDSAHINFSSPVACNGDDCLFDDHFIN